jgi:hypothetical protein
MTEARRDWQPPDGLNLLLSHCLLVGERHEDEIIARDNRAFDVKCQAFCC